MTNPLQSEWDVQHDLPQRRQMAWNQCPQAWLSGCPGLMDDGVDDDDDDDDSWSHLSMNKHRNHLRQGKSTPQKPWSKCFIIKFNRHSHEKCKTCKTSFFVHCFQKRVIHGQNVDGGWSYAPDPTEKHQKQKWEKKKQRNEEERKKSKEKQLWRI